MTARRPNRFRRSILLPLKRLNQSAVLVARASAGAGALYDPLAGNATLRTHIARRAVGQGVSVQRDDVIVTSGAIEAIQLCLRAVAKPGDAVVVERPTYFGGLRLLEEIGLRAVEVPTHPTTGMDLQARRLNGDRLQAVRGWRTALRPNRRLDPRQTE